MDVASVHGILQARTLGWFAIPSHLENPHAQRSLAGYSP